MKFKKDGKVFEDIEAARKYFCPNFRGDAPFPCYECKVFSQSALACKGCHDFVTLFPAEAARLMGYEVINDFTHGGWPVDNEDKEANMDKQSTTSQVNPPEPVNCGSSKPRICEVLGVEVGEHFRVESDSFILFPEAFVDESGIVRASAGQSMGGLRVCQLISGELRIIRQPRFTEEEVADARGLYQVWPDAVVRRKDTNDLCIQSYAFGFSVPLPRDKFFSLRLGQSIALSDIVVGEA